jgi:hypothetical protein
MLPMRTKNAFVFSIQMVLLLIIGGAFVIQISQQLIAASSNLEPTDNLDNPSGISVDINESFSPLQKMISLSERNDGLRILGDQINHFRELGLRLADHIRSLRPTALGETLVDQANHARYWVALYVNGEPKQPQSRLMEALTKRGYSVTSGESLRLRPGRAGYRSTVYYFHDDAFGAADELARFMGNLAKGNFDVRRSSGLPILMEQQRWAFLVQYVSDVGGG